MASNHSLEAWLDFRKGENPKPVKLVCTECGGNAEGNCSWTDGTGEICNACNALFEVEELPVILNH
jgi:hypothetical protein